jgi:tetratricopeptide (TPR) repeat protein
VFAGNFYNSYGQAAEAEQHLLKAVELSPRKQTILFQLGSVYIMQKKYDKALEIFKKAYDFEPSYPDAKRFYAAALLYVGREADARALLADAPGVIDEALLSVYADLARWDKVLRTKIAADPKNSQNRMNLVAAYFQSGNKQAAIATLQEMIVLDPSFKTTGEQYIQQIQTSQ